MSRKTYPVLDDNTRDAFVIGHAADNDEAAAVWREYYRSRMDYEDWSALKVPSFALRHTETVVSPEPAFEPI